MRRTEHQETVGRKHSSSRMRRKQSQQRAFRSHKQLKPPPPPHGSAPWQQPTRPWTWVLQPTILETRAQRRRYLHMLLTRCVRVSVYLHMWTLSSCILSSHQAGSLPAVAWLTCLWSTLYPIRALQQVNENCFCHFFFSRILYESVFVLISPGGSSNLIGGFADFSSPAASASLPTSTGKPYFSAGFIL